jgi:hypothetical protein
MDIGRVLWCTKWIYCTVRLDLTGVKESIAATGRSVRSTPYVPIEIMFPVMALKHHNSLEFGTLCTWCKYPQQILRLNFKWIWGHFPDIFPIRFLKEKFCARFISYTCCMTHQYRLPWYLLFYFSYCWEETGSASDSLKNSSCLLESSTVGLCNMQICLTLQSRRCIVIHVL